MFVMKIDQSLLDSLSVQAAKSSRLRQAYDLRTSSADQSQRILNALEQERLFPFIVTGLRLKLWLWYEDVSCNDFIMILESWKRFLKCLLEVCVVCCKFLLDSFIRWNA